MAKVSIRCEGFDLLMDFDSNDADDQEIMAEAFLLIHRRAKQEGRDNG